MQPAQPTRDPGIGASVAFTLGAMAHDIGGDVLDISSHYEVTEIEEEERTGYAAEFAADALRGTQDGQRRHLLDFARDARMDPITAALLAHYDVDPMAACVIGHALAKQPFITLVIHDGSDHEDRDRRTVATLVNGRWVVELASEIGVARWHSNGELRLPPVPETLLTAADGGPLGRLLQHAALDPLGLVIEGHLVDDDGSVTIAVPTPQATLGPRDLDRLHGPAVRMRKAA